MEFHLKYSDELNKLIENENDIEFFRKLMVQRDNSEIMKETINGLLKFSKEHNLNSTKAWAYYYLGWYHFDKSHYDKAVECFLVSNDIFEVVNNNIGTIYACNGLTTVYCQIGQYKISNEWGLKGISLCEELGNTKEIVILLINTGINYIQMKYFEKAKDIFHSIIIMDIELNKTQQISYYLALAEIEINIGQATLACSYIDKVLSIEEELCIDMDICEIHRLRGMAYVKLGLYDLAEEAFKMSCEFANKYDNIYEQSRALIEWSKLQILVGRKQEAIKNLNKVVHISSNKKMDNLLRETYHMLYNIFKDLKKADKALEFLEEYILIDDKMYDYEQNQLMAKMNFKHTKRAADQYKSLYDKTELLSTIGQKIICNLDIKSIINIINEEINKLIETDYFGIAVYDEDSDQATYYFVGEELQIQEVIQYNESDSSTFGSYCIKNKKDIIIGNSDREYKQYISNLPTEFDVAKGKSCMMSLIYTPLVINEKVVGLMTVQNKEKNAYDQNDLNTLKILANYSAIAIENAKSYKKVEELATYDNLTRFLNKSEIIRLGEFIYDKYKESNSRFSVTMIDIDNFKTVNDTYGHVNGDKALSMVANVVSKCIRNTDYIGRYGGDEFLLICPGLGEPEAVAVAERIRSTVEGKIFNLADNINVSITLSLGVHEFNTNDTSFMDVVKLADKNLYCAKEGNRNLVVCN